MIWSKLLTQHHFINTERFAPADGVRRDMRRAENAGDKLIALFVGYLIPDKGVDIALRALAKAPSDICLWIVGGGPEQSKLEALVAELGLTDRVRMFGPQTNVQRYMQSADLLLCPSLWAEAAGLVNLEAQACGLPVVASRIGGIPEYVADERTGLLFEPGNSDDLSRQLRRIVDEPGLLRRLSSQARPWILDNFSPERRIPDVLNSYRTSGGNA